MMKESFLTKLQWFLVRSKDASFVEWPFDGDLIDIPRFSEWLRSLNYRNALFLLVIAYLVWMPFAIPVFKAATSYTRYLDVDCGTPGDGTTSTCSGGTAPWNDIEDANNWMKGTLSTGDDVTIYINRDTDISDMESFGYECTSGSWPCYGSLSSITLPDNASITIDAYGSGAKPRFMTETMGIVYWEASSQTNTVNWTIKNIQAYGTDYSPQWWAIDIRLTDGDVLVDGVDVDGRGDGNPQQFHGNFIHLFQTGGDNEIMNCTVTGLGPYNNPGQSRGTATNSSPSTTVLEDSTASWTTSPLQEFAVAATIKNVTNGSTCTAQSNTATSVTCVSPLSGGGTFTNGDEYLISFTDTNFIGTANGDAYHNQQSLKIHDNTCDEIGSDCIIILGQGGSSSNWVEIYDNEGSNAGENIVDLKNTDYVKIYRNKFWADTWGQGGSAGELNALVRWGTSTQSYEEDPDEIYVFGNEFDGNYKPLDSADDRHNACVTSQNMNWENNDQAYIFDNILKNCAPHIWIGSGILNIWNNIMINDVTLEQDEGPNYKTFIVATEYFQGLNIYYNSMYEKSGAGMTSAIRITWTGTNPTAINWPIRIKNNLIELNTLGAYMFYSPEDLQDFEMDYNRYYNPNGAIILEDTPNRVYEDGEEPAILATSASEDWIEISGHTHEESQSIPYNDKNNGDLTLTTSVDGVDIGAGPTGDEFDQDWTNGLSPEGDLPPLAVTEISRDTYGHKKGAFALLLKISDASPEDNATNIAVNADLSWTNPNGYISVDVYFEEISGSCDLQVGDRVYDDQDVNSYDPGTMNENSDYCWRVDINHAGGTETGDEYSFSTTDAPPPPADDTTTIKYKSGGAAIKYKSGGSLIKH